MENDVEDVIFWNVRVELFLATLKWWFWYRSKAMWYEVSSPCIDFKTSSIFPNTFLVSVPNWNVSTRNFFNIAFRDSGSPSSCKSFNQNKYLLSKVECSSSCRAFQDTTGYRPVDDPRYMDGWEWGIDGSECVDDCTKWQPLQEEDGYGGLRRQEFAAFFLNQTMRLSGCLGKKLRSLDS